MNVLKTLVLMAVLAMAQIAHAQDVQTLKIATGDPKGSNSQMFKTVVSLCPNLVTEDTSTTGGADNINKLLMNQVDGGIAQADVVAFLAKTDSNVEKLRSLVTLNSNMLHIIASSSGFMVDPGKAGTLGFGKKAATYKTISTLKDLYGLPVAGFGSGQITARILSDRLNLNLTVIDVEDKDKGLEMVRSGQVAAMFALGGRPIPWIASIPANNGSSEFTLVGIPADTVKQLGSPYEVKQLTYKNLGVFGFTTLAAKNELYVRDYKGAKASLLGQLRSCYETNLDNIKETTGSHPAWQDVDDLTTSSWTRFEVAKSVQVKAPVTAPKK